MCATRLRPRAEYEQKYTAQANASCLMATYEKAFDSSPATARGRSQLGAIG